LTQRGHPFLVSPLALATNPSCSSALSYRLPTSVLSCCRGCCFFSFCSPFGLLLRTLLPSSVVVVPMNSYSKGRFKAGFSALPGRLRNLLCFTFFLLFYFFYLYSYFVGLTDFFSFIQPTETNRNASFAFIFERHANCESRMERKKVTDSESDLSRVRFFLLVFAFVEMKWRRLRVLPLSFAPQQK